MALAPIQVAGPCSSVKHRAELLRTTATRPCAITVCHWSGQPSRVSSLPRSSTRSSIQQRLAGPHCSPRLPTPLPRARPHRRRSEEHTTELQSRLHLVCRLLLEKKKKKNKKIIYGKKTT